MGLALHTKVPSCRQLKGTRVTAIGSFTQSPPCLLMHSRLGIWSVGTVPRREGMSLPGFEPTLKTLLLRRHEIARLSIKCSGRVAPDFSLVRAFLLLLRRALSLSPLAGKANANDCVGGSPAPSCAYVCA